MIGMQGDANVILRNAINVNQGLQMIDYADANLQRWVACTLADACHLL